MLETLLLFFREFAVNFTTTGAIAPSSPALARAMLKPLAHRLARPVRVLEVGPGTGAFTFKILAHLRPGDALHVYELNDQFHRFLYERLQARAEHARGIDLQLHHRDIRELDSAIRYDYIISSLPFANFEPEVVGGIMDNFFRHLHPDGVLSFFEYLLPHRMRMLFLKPAERERIRRLGTKMGEYIRRHQVGSNLAWLNLPPARARHLRHK